jgi:hypothetical protein
MDQTSLLDGLLPLPVTGAIAHQWAGPLRKRIEGCLYDLFHRLDARTLTWEQAVQGITQMKAYHELLKEIERDARQFEAEQRRRVHTP